MSTKQSTDYQQPSAWLWDNSALRANNERYFAERWPAETAKNLVTAFGVGAGVTGLGHLLSKLTASKPKKKHDQFSGSPVESEPIKIANAVTTPASAAPGPGVWSDQSMVNKTLWGGLNIAGSAGAFLGGGYLLNKLVSQRKKQEQQARVEAAREEYERELGVKTAELDALWQEKMARSWVGAAADGAGRLLDMPALNELSNLYGMYAGTAALGGAGVAGKLVYDMTKQRSNAAALQKAREAKARLSSLPPMWVTPDDIISLRDKNKQAPQMADAA